MAASRIITRVGWSAGIAWSFALRLCTVTHSSIASSGTGFVWSSHRYLCTIPVHLPWPVAYSAAYPSVPKKLLRETTCTWLAASWIGVPW